ncbi:MAG: histidine phosphatase family protein [Actinomycetota bacterium]
MAEFVVVRHGRPLTERLDSGIADPSLDEYGQWQADRVSAWLAHEPVDAIVASPKARAIETIRPLADALDRSVQIVDDLDEIDRFSSVYVPTDMWATDGLDILEALGEKRYDDIGYDPPDVFRARIENVWAELVAEPPGEHVVIACHGGTIREIIRATLGEMPSTFHAQLEYASICRFSVGGGRASLVTLNETGHFDAARETMRGAMNVAPTIRP